MTEKDWLKHPEQKYISQGAKDLIRPEREPESEPPKASVNTKCITTNDVYGIFEEMSKDNDNRYIDIMKTNKDDKNSCRITTVSVTGRSSVSVWNIVKVIK